MNLRPILAVFVSALAAGSCGVQKASHESDGPWVGTAATEGNVTTVINESGSVWGGLATLVEEASIGSESGPDEYMFGYINSLYANTERIVILDEQANAVRVFAQTGRFLFSVGRTGQGPGEHRRAMIVTMDSEGRTFVFDTGNDRLTEYSSSGEYVTSFQVSDFGCCAWNMHPRSRGFLWVPLRDVDPNTLEIRYGAQMVSTEAEGLVGDPVWVPEIDFDVPTFEVAGRRIRTPFSPRLVWRPTPTGEVLFGNSDHYRFEILRADGSKTVVERFWRPTPIDPEEREWHRRLTVADWRSRVDGWKWDGTEIPQHKPAFTSLFGGGGTGESGWCAMSAPSA